MYLCVGLWSLDCVPSPKVHNQAVGLPVLLSMNCTQKGADPLVCTALKCALGCCVAGSVPGTVMVWLVELLLVSRPFNY